MKYIIITLIMASLLVGSCTKPEVLPADYYTCQLPFVDSSSSHPNDLAYQNILERSQKLGAVGVSVMIKDEHGVWLGTAGMADIANNVQLQPCHSMFIASITKVFTSSMIYTFIEDGILSLDDYVKDWIDATTLKKLANADKAQIKHLLSHTSGIPDYYTTSYDMMRMNAYYNGLSHEETLKFAKGLKAYNEVGEGYRYCNTNYLLLGMIMEAASGKNLSELFDSRIFNPMQFESAVYGGENPIPDGVAKGYVDIYGDGKFVESMFLYKDELNTADGGIAINAYETGRFFEKLLKGEVISSESLSTMLNSFELPDGRWDPKYHPLHGAYGIEKFITPNGVAYGHTGSIMGFSSVVQYFPDLDKTFVMIVNSSSYNDDPQEEIYNACMELMF
ncbi:MAG: beta-lactamase family protein [Bacteroidia bacterium]